ncbi:hypothetical protein J3B01_004217, partial [Coemansia erecta]
MFKLVLSTVALAAINAAPIAEPGMIHYPHSRRDMFGSNCPGCFQGIQFTGSGFFPNTQFSAPGFQHTTVYPDLKFGAGSAQIFGSNVGH